MITKLNVASIYVLDKDQALDFYVNKLGLEKGQDVSRAPTVADGARPGNGTEIPGAPGSPLHDDATAAQLRELIAKGAMSPLSSHRRRPRFTRPSSAWRHRLHPGANGALLRHRHGPPRPVRQRDPDPPTGQGRPEGDGLTWLSRRPRRSPRAGPRLPRD